MKNRRGRRQEVVSKSKEILLGYRNPTCNLNDAIYPKYTKSLPREIFIQKREQAHM